MSRSRSNSVPPHEGQVRPAGMNSSIGRSYQASAPYCSNTSAACSTSAGVMRASPHFVQSTAGIGTPQARWREMHQSGRFDTMLKMRSWPHAGIQVTSWSIACSAAARSVRCLTVGALDHRVAVHPHEPLCGGEKDDRVVAAPAVRVLVRERLTVPEARALLEGLFDVRIGVEHPLTAEQFHRLEEMTARARRARRCRGRSAGR